MSLNKWHMKEPEEVWRRLGKNSIFTTDNEDNRNTKENWDELYTGGIPGRMGWGIHDIVADEIDDGQRILEIGGVGGQGASKIMGIHPNSRITVLDISELAIEYGKARYDNMEFICIDYVDYHTDEKYDVIIAAQVLEHFDDIVFIMMKLMSMLVVGGTLYISVPHEDAKYPWHQHRFSHDSYNFFRSFSKWVSFGSDGAILGANADLTEEKHMLVRLVKDTPTPRRKSRRVLMEAGKSALAMYFPTNQPIYGGNYNEVAMGGAETNAMILCEALADKYVVYVFGSCTPHDYNGVHYVNINDFKYYTHMIDTVIVNGANMHTHILNGTMYDIPNVIMWSHICGGPDRSQEDIDIIYDNIDLELFMSKWHRDGYCNEMMRVNGIDVRKYSDKFIVLQGYSDRKYVKVLPREDRGKYMVYSSMPFRGLDLFDRILPRIKELCPDLVLHTYSSATIYNNPDAKEVYPEGEAELKELLSRHGNVVHHHLVPFTELMDIMANAMLYVYPARIHETMPNGVTQAMRCGTPVISSRHSGITEVNGDGPYLVHIPDTVQDGNQMRAHLTSDTYIDTFVDNIVKLYNDEGAWNAESRRCVEVSDKYDLSNCVSAISDFIDR